MAPKVATRELTDRVILIEGWYGDVALNLIYVRDQGILLDTSTSGMIRDIVGELGMPKLAIVTHPHEDHAGGSRFLADNGVEVVSHELAKAFLHNAQVNVDHFFPVRFRRCFSQDYADSFVKSYMGFIGSPRITRVFKGSFEAGGVKCIEAFGHAPGTIVCIADGVMFTSDAVQGAGLKGSSTTDSIPQISSIEDYLVTLNRLMRIKVNSIVPAHNFLPYGKRVLEGDEAYSFLQSSVDAVLRLLEISESILSKPATLCEFAEELLRQYGVKRGLYPQALITANAILNFYRRRGVLSVVSEGDVEVYKLA